MFCIYETFILLLSSIHCIVSIYHNFFIYFYIDENLFFSDVLAILNEATVNILV